MKNIKLYVGGKELSDKIDEEIWADPEKFAGQHIVVISPETFPKIFTMERIKLLKALEAKPKNMTELVAMLGRPREAVSRDVSYLSGFGLVDVKDVGKQRVPSRPAPISVSM